MSLEQAAKHLAAHGRGPDTELIHMTKGEIHGLQQLAKANGGSLTVNPHTGLPEAGFLSNILPAVAGAAAMYFSAGTAAPLLSGLSAAQIGMGIGGLETLRTGSLQKGMMAGMGAYGGAGLAGGLMASGAAAGAAPTAGAANAAGTGAANAAATNAANYSLAPTAAGNTAAMSAAPGMGSMAPQIAAAGSAPAATPMWKYGLAAAAPAMMGGQEQPQTPVGDSTMPQRLKYDQGTATPFPQPDVPGYDNLGQDFGRQQNYFPNAGYKQITPEEAKSIRGYADGGYMSGGPVEAMSNAAAIGENTGYPQADITGHAYATPWQTPVSQNVVQGSADTGVNRMSGQMLADGGAVKGFDLGGIAKLAEQVGGGGSPQGSYNPMDGGGGLADIIKRLQAEGRLANGGTADAHYNLGGYSDGGRLLRGPGDGVSDSIPATIGNKRPARLADGEFVVPARIVSELGNGSTEAGARKLYAMLDRVQSARKKSIGKGKVAKNSRADKYLPA